MPFITILIGPSGSGKSTYARFMTEFQSDSIILNADTMRGVLCNGNIGDQSKNELVFSAVFNMLEYFCRMGSEHIVIDNTNLSKISRKRFIEIGKKYNYDVDAVYFPIDAESCKNNIATRAKNGGLNVPEHVVDKQFAKFEKPEYSEGFDTINAVGKDFFPQA
jgi:predicted kinase